MGSWLSAKPPAPKLLVSRRTPEWTRLLAEGLFSDEYPRPQLTAEQARNLREDEARVAQQWPNGACSPACGECSDPAHSHASPTPRTAGCKLLPGGQKRCLPRLIIMGQFKCGTTALFDTLAQHPDLLLLHTKEDFTQKCPRQQPRCVIKEANGFIRVADDGRWTETVLLNKYDPLTPDVPLNDTRPVLEASPYYLSGMPDSFEDLTRLPRYVPGVKMIALVRNPVERAFSEYVMLSEPPFRRNRRGCKFGHNFSFEDLMTEELELQSPALQDDPKTMNFCLRESTKWQPALPLPNGTSRFRGRLLGWGDYSRFAEAWMRVLPPEQLLFVKREDMEHPDRQTALIQQILLWAGLRDLPLRVRRSNTAACRGSHARGAFDKQREEEIESGKCDEPQSGAPQQSMTPEIATRLHAHFQKRNRRFAELTGLDLSDWEKSTRFQEGTPAVAGQD